MLEYNYRFEALGTKWVIETNIPIPAVLKEKIQKRINAFDATYSRFRYDSLISKIATQSGKHEFPQDAKKLIHFYKEMYDITKGMVTPLIGDAISRAGYDASYSFIPVRQKAIAQWDEVLRWDGKSLVNTEPITLDFGAAGKGYLVDIVALLLDEAEFEQYVIDASGDIRHKGRSENKVGLEHPVHQNQIIGVVDVQNKSLCASAINRRQWGNGMHHIFDPIKLEPTKDIIATWVIADDTMLADGIATALFFSEPATIKRKYNFEFVRMFHDGRIEFSPFFESKLF